MWSCPRWAVFLFLGCTTPCEAISFTASPFVFYFSKLPEYCTVQRVSLKCKPGNFPNVPLLSASGTNVQTSVYKAEIHPLQVNGNWSFLATHKTRAFIFLKNPETWALLWDAFPIKNISACQLPGLPVSFWAPVRTANAFSAMKILYIWPYRWRRMDACRISTCGLWNGLPRHL